MPLQALLLPPLWLSIAQRFKKNNDNALLTFWLPMQCQEHPPKCQEHRCQEHPAECQEHLPPEHPAAAERPEHPAAAKCPEPPAAAKCPEHPGPLIVGPCREGHREQRHWEAKEAVCRQQKP